MDAGRHPLIEVITNAEVIGCEGEAGEFKVQVRKNPRFGQKCPTFAATGTQVCPNC